MHFKSNKSLSILFSGIIILSNKYLPVVQIENYYYLNILHSNHTISDTHDFLPNECNSKDM